VQSITFSAMGSGVGIAYDLESGMIDRFRSLPIARSAFLVGRTWSDSLRLGIQSILLVGAALIIGFEFHNGWLGALGMIVVIVLFGIALTAFSAWVGLVIRDPETVQPAVFIPILPLVFTSSAFAPVDRLPDRRMEPRHVRDRRGARARARRRRPLPRQPRAHRHRSVAIRAVVHRHRGGVHRARRAPLPARLTMGRRLAVVLAVRGLVVVAGIVVAIVGFADGDTFIGVLFTVLALANAALILYFLRRQHRAQ
jgi:hypothetical protein